MSFSPAGRNLLQALVRKYESDILAAAAQMQMHLTTTPASLDTLDQFLESMMFAQEKLTIIRQQFMTTPTSPSPVDVAGGDDAPKETGGKSRRVAEKKASTNA